MSNETVTAARDAKGGFDLQGQIMNIAAPAKVKAELAGAPKGFYLLGHRDARHAAAELAVAYEVQQAALMEQMAGALTATLKGNEYRVIAPDTEPHWHVRQMPSLDALTAVRAALAAYEGAKT